MTRRAHHRRLRTLAAALLAVTLAPALAPAPAKADPRFVPGPCWFSVPEGEAALCGQSLAEAQGAGIVSGLRTPGPLAGADTALEAGAPAPSAGLGRTAD
ncbi:hypothetical protein GAY30_11025, partial [Azospirillum brasilense]|nr:hypothetical protein [Azospirillum brasilense]